MWMVRAGEGAAFAEKFIKIGRVALGGAGNEDFFSADRDTLRQQLANTHPVATMTSISRWVSEDLSFRDEMAVGDLCVTYNSVNRVFWVGIISSEPFHDNEFMRDHRAWAMNRSVLWSGQVPRVELTETAQKFLSFRHSVRRLSGEVAQELLGKASSL